MSLQEAIDHLSKGHSLSEKESEKAFEALVSGDHTEEGKRFLKQLSEKGETAEELKGLVRVMQKKMRAVTFEEEVLDIVGTGGDGSNSVNISTGAAILAAACGALVAKHGNRASSSKCGSADVLEELGISLEEDPVEALARAHITFLYAPHFHPAAKRVAPMRKALGIRTIFNLVGPLLNPARPTYLLLGVAKESLLDLFANVVQTLGVKRSMIVYGNGMDELTPIGPCQALLVTPEERKKMTLDPQDFGFKKCTMKDLEGGDAKTNASILTAALKGEKGPVADTLILNAGVALFVTERAPSIESGISFARHALESGKGFETLEKWRKR
ncbi:MAG: anthranilate phosphoribosyltransferase [Chlamydiales bacterium]|nr:anthranilate phosphoribosyltransferase [Chlamydiales bacterium]